MFGVPVYPFLSNGFSLADSVVILFVDVLSWLIRKENDLTSVRSSGLGKFLIAWSKTWIDAHAVSSQLYTSKSDGLLLIFEHVAVECSSLFATALKESAHILFMFVRVWRSAHAVINNVHHVEVQLGPRPYCDWNVLKWKNYQTDF